MIEFARSGSSRLTSGACPCGSSSSKSSRPGWTRCGPRSPRRFCTSGAVTRAVRFVPFLSLHPNRPQHLEPSGVSAGSRENAGLDAGSAWGGAIGSTVNPEVAGSSPVEPATKSRSCRTPQTASNVNVTENVTDARGRRISEGFRTRIFHRPADAAESFCAAESRSASLTIAYRL
jgi:hypothetical protein